MSRSAGTTTGIKTGIKTATQAATQAATEAAAKAARPLRADARHNHGQLLAAARDVFVERGPGAPLEEVARRAGVGIGTLYRRFPDRDALLTAIVLDALVLTRRAAEEALAEEPDAFDALTRYMHSALDLRVSAIIPLVLDRIEIEDPQLMPARDASSRSIVKIVDAAHRAGSLAEDVTFADIGMLLVRLARPLPGRISTELNDRLAHRHLDLLIAGLRPKGRRRKPPSGPALTQADLRAIREGRG